MAVWHGSGVGRPTGRVAWKYSYGSAYVNATSHKRQRVDEGYTVGGYESDINGNYYWEIWEWKY
jgi:hypothetical protein